MCCALVKDSYFWESPCWCAQPETFHCTGLPAWSWGEQSTQRISCYHSDEWAAVHLSFCYPQGTFHCFVYWAAVFKIKNSQMFYKILRGTALASLIRLSMSLCVSLGWWSQSAWLFSHLKDALRWHASSHKGCWSYHTAELVTIGVLHFNCGFSNEILQKQNSLLCTSEFLFVREALLEKNTEVIQW